jgi:hypothetical protein
VIMVGTLERAYVVAMGLSGRPTAKVRTDLGDGSRFGDKPPF